MKLNSPKLWLANTFLLFCLPGFSQSGFGFAGGSVSGPTARIDYSAGLFGYNQFSDSGYKVTAGNQQPAGCSDPIADQYTSAAIYDDGSCTYNNLVGCTDPVADNFSPTAITDDGSCTYVNVTGCTDPAAANYQPTAIFDNGSCLYPGCTYAAANNYNPAANVDDGSCTFDPPCSSCPADLDGNLVVNVEDLLLFMSVFGTFCP